MSWLLLNFEYRLEWQRDFHKLFLTDKQPFFTPECPNHHIRGLVLFTDGILDAYSSSA